MNHRFSTTVFRSVVENESTFCYFSSSPISLAGVCWCFSAPVFLLGCTKFCAYQFFADICTAIGGKKFSIFS
jgi:hypothetical protein